MAPTRGRSSSTASSSDVSSSSSSPSSWTSTRGRSSSTASSSDVSSSSSSPSSWTSTRGGPPSTTSSSDFCRLPSDSNSSITRVSFVPWLKFDGMIFFASSGISSYFEANLGVEERLTSPSSLYCETSIVTSSMVNVVWLQSTMGLSSSSSSSSISAENMSLVCCST